MIGHIKCFYCGHLTAIIFRKVTSKHKNGAEIVLNESPVHFCPACKEVIFSAEVLKALKYIKSSVSLVRGQNEFNYQDIFMRSQPPKRPAASNK